VLLSYSFPEITTTASCWPNGREVPAEATPGGVTGLRRLRILKAGNILANDEAAMAHKEYYEDPRGVLEMQGEAASRKLS